MGGRVTRYPMRSSEKTEPGRKRDVQLGERWMDAMSVDYSCLFPTGMLNIGLHPQKEMEVELCWAYNRWLTEKVLPESGGRMFSMLCLPFSDPDASPAPGRNLRRPQGRRRLHGDDRAQQLQVNDNAYMKVYRAMEERGLALVVPLRPELGASRCSELQPLHLGACARLLLLQHPPLHQLGDQRHGRALPQAAGDLDRGRARLDPVPDAAARPRIHDAPVGGAAAQEEAERLHARHVLLVAADGDSGHARRMEWTFRMMNAETQLLYASDYPHWDFDLPSTIYDLPFLSEKAKHNILGGTAARLFKLPPRNEKQKAEPEQVRQSGGLSVRRDQLPHFPGWVRSSSDFDITYCVVATTCLPRRWMRGSGPGHDSLIRVGTGGNCLAP